MGENFTADLVERVAAKIYSPGGAEYEPWEEQHPEDKQVYMVMARAALEFLDGIGLLKPVS